MKKLIFLVLLLTLLITACKEYTVADGIALYNPREDDSPGIFAEIPAKATIKQLVREADVIAKVFVENLTYVEVIIEDKNALGDKGIFGEFNYSKVYYTWAKNEADGREINAYIDYNPLYTNVTDPGFEVAKEYIVFLRRFSPDEPYVYNNFYDYYLLNDYVTYMLDATEENEELVIALIESNK